ncbi:hypothetical protein XELAEV_18026412mg, partial [Xenopus laevis]
QPDTAQTRCLSYQKNILEKLAFCAGFAFLPFGTDCILFAFEYSTTREGNQAQRSANSTGTVLATQHFHWPSAQEQ